MKSQSTPVFARLRTTASPPAAVKLARTCKASVAVTLALAGIALLAAPAPARADVLVTYSGFWGTDFQSSADAMDGASYSLSFDLPDAISAPDAGAIYNATTLATNFTYVLNGTTLGVSLNEVDFWSSNDGGFFNLVLSDGFIINLGYYSWTEYLSGPDIGYSGTLQTGTWSPDIGSGNGFTSITPGTLTLSQVPEPGTLTLIAAGLFSLGLVRRSRA